jgi:hypothetical protein
MRAKEHKSQHFVARTYLKSWCDPETPDRMEPYVWVFDGDGSHGRPKAPKKLFQGTDFYTIPIPNGGRDLVLEHRLQELEDQFARIRDEKLVPERPVTAEEGAYLFAFMIAMSFRTEAHRERRRAEWRQVLEAMERAAQLTNEQGRSPTVRFSFSPDPDAHSLSIDDVSKIVERPMQYLLPTEIATYLPLMAGMGMMVMRTDDPIGFISSDDPCIWLNDKMNAGPPVIRDLGAFGILMPLSPQQMLFLNPATSCYGRATSLDFVNKLNRMTVAHASAEIVVCRNGVRREWFEQGTD